MSDSLIPRVLKFMTIPITVTTLLFVIYLAKPSIVILIIRSPVHYHHHQRYNKYLEFTAVPGIITFQKLMQILCKLSAATHGCKQSALNF